MDRKVRGRPRWVIFQSAGWVNFQSALTSCDSPDTGENSTVIGCCSRCWYNDHPRRRKRRSLPDMMSWVTPPLRNYPESARAQCYQTMPLDFIEELPRVGLPGHTRLRLSTLICFLVVVVAVIGVLYLLRITGERQIVVNKMTLQPARLLGGVADKRKAVRRIATYDYGNWGKYGSNPTMYPPSSLTELSWVQIGVDATAEQTNYYSAHGIKTYSYGDEGLIYADERGPQRAWAAAMGAPPPPPNGNYYTACSNGGPVHTGKPNAYIANPYFAFRRWKAHWQSQFPGYSFKAWYIDGLQEAGFKDSNDLPTHICASGTRYAWDDGHYNLINSFIIQGIEQIPDSKAVVLCDCWGGDSGEPYITTGYPFGLSAKTAGDLPPTVGYYGAVAGGRSEGAYVNNGVHNSLAVWQGVENMAIVTGNSHLYDFLQPWINEDAASDRGLADRMFIIASIDLTVNCALVERGACTGYTVYQLLISGDASGRAMCFYSDDVNCTHVYPEVYVTFADPVVPTPANSVRSVPGCSDCSGIQTFLSSNGTYYREYLSGYLNGTRVGRCVVDVNPDTVVHRWPSANELSTDYTAGFNIVALRLHGANIDSGGTARFVSGVAPMRVDPGVGIIVCDRSL
jgi:hypothetical protein